MLPEAPRGLLEDQIAVAAACLDAWDASGNIVYEMMAEELAHYAIRVMWDEAGHGFFDREVADAPEAIGRMRERLKPFGANCNAAMLLRRLAQASGDATFSDRAAELLDYTPGGPARSVAALNDNGAADEIHGESGDDFIYGMRGNDVLFGEGQDDDLIGGYGHDWISGGTGQDGALGDDGRIFTSRNGVAEPLYGIGDLAGQLDLPIDTPGDVQ